MGLYERVKIIIHNSKILFFDKTAFLLYTTNILKLSASADFLNYGNQKHSHYSSRRPRQDNLNRCFDEADRGGRRGLYNGYK